MLLRQLKEFLGFQDNTDILLFIFSNESGSINFYVSFKRKTNVRRFAHTQWKTATLNVDQARPYRSLRSHWVRCLTAGKKAPAPERRETDVKIRKEIISHKCESFQAPLT